MHTFQYVFWNKVCPLCHTDTVEDFWIEHGSDKIHRNYCHCPKCKQVFDFNMNKPDELWISNVRYILESEKYIFIRKVQENELIKKHGVEAHWFPIGRMVYSDSAFLIEKEILLFQNQHAYPDKKLVYMINNYLQRLYFFVPLNALQQKIL